MNKLIALAAVLVLAVSIGFAGVSEAGDNARHHRPGHHHNAAVASPPSGLRGGPIWFGPAPARSPAPADAPDGLSTDPDKCNTGCVGGNPS